MTLFRLTPVGQTHELEPGDYVLSGPEGEPQAFFRLSESMRSRAVAQRFRDSLGPKAVEAPSELSETRAIVRIYSL